jgi:ferrous iron transport protein B
VKKKHIKLALAGNANVGKSVIFNHLTGMHQHIGNWPGKTVEKAEGTLKFEDYTVDVIDLPGIYSLSTFSIEEIITREYIAEEKPDVVINVIDASILERNLFFTLQLIELDTPMIVALNQIDMAKKKGIKIDEKKLEEKLGVPVIPTVAPSHKGIYELLKSSVEMVEKRPSSNLNIQYGEEIENRIRKLDEQIRSVELKYPSRWVAIKLLEGDSQIEELVQRLDSKILSFAKKLRKELEDIHGHSCTTVVSSERYEVAGCIARDVQKIVPPKTPQLREKLHEWTTHRIAGYPIMAGIVLLIFFTIFSLGDLASGLMNDSFLGCEPLFKDLLGGGVLVDLVWGGVIEGLVAGITIVLPYLLPFYLVLHVLEDSGYLSRIAFLMDNLMHKIGLHGKAFIPMMLGFGCNVSACLGCRILETERERLIAIFVTTLVPCAATTVIVFGLVGTYVGFEWALLLYLVNFLVILVLGRIAFKSLPGEPTGLIMEMHDFRVPHLQTVGKQTWFMLKEFVKMAFPLIIVGSFVVKLIEVADLLEPIASVLSPITVAWLGLPAITGIALIFGVLRKELALVMLATLLGSADFSQVPGFGAIQMIVFSLVAMLYIPCISTIAALVKEIGWKKASLITLIEIALAIIVGGLAYRLLLFINVFP